MKKEVIWGRYDLKGNQNWNGQEYGHEHEHEHGHGHGSRIEDFAGIVTIKPQLSIKSPSLKSQSIKPQSSIKSQSSIKPTQKNDEGE